MEPLKEIRAVINDSAKSSSLLWASFVLFTVYTLLTTGSVSTGDILKAKVVTIPIVNISVQFTAYAMSSSVLLAVFAIYVYVQMNGLATKASEYRLLSASSTEASVLDQSGILFDLFPLIQLVISSRSDRLRIYNVLLIIVIIGSLFVIPAVTMISALIKFLPYHDQYITWVQRISILILAASFFCFFERLIRLSEWTDEAYASSLIIMIATFISVSILSIFVVIFPGEYIYGNTFSENFGSVSWDSGKRVVKPFFRTLFEGPLIISRGEKESLFSNSLIVTSLEELKDSTEKSHSFSLSGRDLKYAAFIGVQMSDLDFSGSDLTGSLFYSVTLPGSRFDCHDEKDHAAYSRDKTPWPDGCTRLNGAHFILSDLRGASFYGARARWASFSFVDMQGAYLMEANLQASSFVLSKLNGANFEAARLTASRFHLFQLAAVNFDNAWLVGAELTVKRLYAVSMQGTKVIRLSGDIKDISKSRLSVTLNNYDLFESKKDEAFLSWRKGIEVDKPDNLLSLENLDGPEIPNLDLTIDSPAVTKPVDFKKWDKDNVKKDSALLESSDDQIASKREEIVEENKNLIKQDIYVDGLVSVACSAAGRPYIGRSILGIGKIHLTLSRVMFEVLIGYDPEVDTLNKKIAEKKKNSESCPGLKEIFDLLPLRFE